MKRSIVSVVALGLVGGAASGGDLELAISAGASWLLPVSFTATESVGLGLTSVGVDITIPRLTLRASGGTEGAWGANGGAGLQIAVGGRAALVAEGRLFYFPERVLAWTRIEDRPQSAIEQAPAREIQDRLGPVEFSPTFFQVTAGIAVRF
jgi:hypothetical protein